MHQPSRAFVFFALCALLISFLASPIRGQSVSAEPSASPSASPFVESSASPSPDASSPSASPVVSSSASPSTVPSTSPSTSPVASLSPSPVVSPSPSASPAVSASPSVSPSPSTSPSPSASPSPSPSASPAAIVSAPASDEDDDGDHWWDHVSNRAAVGLVVAFAVPAIVVGAVVAAYITYKAYNRRRFVETGNTPQARDVESEMEQYPNPVFSLEDDGEEDHNL